MSNKELAEMFINAIKTISEKQNNLDNFECYLSHHFEEWFKTFANTPEKITAELKSFAEMEMEI